MNENHAYKKYRWKWNNYPKYFMVDKVPIHLDIELTTRCNYRCIMCPLTLNPLKPVDMPFEMVKKIIDEFTEKGGCSIKFVYLGEALLYKDLPKVIKYAKQKGIIETIIATNGSLLTEKLAKKLIKSGLDWITYSVDSCKSEVYEQIRVGGILKIVRKNIRNFFEIRKKLDSKTPKIRIQIIRQKINEKEIESGEYEKHWKPYVDHVRISELYYYDNKLKIGETPNFFCDGVFQRLTIRVNGDIALCCGERLDSKILGNISDINIEGAWNGTKFTRVRVLMSERKSHLIEACKTCSGRLNHVIG